MAADECFLRTQERAMSGKVLSSWRKRKGRRKNIKTRLRARENVCEVNEMCFRDRPTSSPRRLTPLFSLSLKARTRRTWTRFLAATFKTRFGGCAFRVAKACLSRTSKRTITRLLREESRRRLNISSSTIGTPIMILYEKYHVSTHHLRVTSKIE